MNIQKQIKAIRENKKFSQRDLAIMTESTQALVCRAEHGQDIRLSTAERFLRVLGYELAVIPIETKEGGE